MVKKKSNKVLKRQLVLAVIILFSVVAVFKVTGLYDATALLTSNPENALISFDEQSLIGLQKQGSGFTVLSADFFGNVESENPDLKKMHWSLTVIPIGNTQPIFSISQDDIANKEPSKIRPANPFYMSVESLSETVTYDLQIQNDLKLWSYTISEWADSDGDDQDHSTCLPGGDTDQTQVVEKIVRETPIPFFGSTYTEKCVLRHFQGHIARMSAPNIGFTAKIGVGNTEKGLLDEKVISNVDKDKSFELTFNDVYGKVAEISWTGSLVTGSYPETLENYRGVLDGNYNSGKEWFFASTYAIIEIKNAQEDFESDVRAIDGMTFTSSYDYDNYLIGLRNRIEQIDDKREDLVDNPETQVAGFLADDFNVLKPTTSDASLEFTSDISYLRPIFNIWLRADFLGLKKVSVKPELLNEDPLNVKVGTDGLSTVVLNVKNPSTTDYVTFAASLQDCGKYTFSKTPKDLPVAPGAIGELPIFLQRKESANTVDEELCKVCVYPLGNVDDSDCIDLKISYTPDKICFDECSVTNTEIYSCSDDGLTKTFIKDCSKDGKVVDFVDKGAFCGDYGCVEDDVEPQEKPAGEGFFNKLLGGFGKALQGLFPNLGLATGMWIAGLLIIALIALVLFRFFNPVATGMRAANRFMPQMPPRYPPYY